MIIKNRVSLFSSIVILVFVSGYLTNNEIGFNRDGCLSPTETFAYQIKPREKKENNLQQVIGR